LVPCWSRLGPDLSGLFRNNKGMSRKITHKVCPIIISLKTRIERAIVIGNTKENIAAAQVVEVIGKSTQCVQNGLRIPAAFKLKPLPLHRAALQNFINIYR